MPPQTPEGRAYDDEGVGGSQRARASRLRSSRPRPDGAGPARPGRRRDRLPPEPRWRFEEVAIPVGGEALRADLEVPQDPLGLVIFAHGTGSSRRSPRNQQVARRLREARLATLLLDLLTQAEANDRKNVFDVALLAARLSATVRWARTQPSLAGLPLGLFGASTGAAAALWAAADPASEVACVVSRGGRPDLAGVRVLGVAAPTLFIVGGADTPTLWLNREARACMGCDAEIAVIPGASHLFEEPGALERVGDLAAAWLTRHLAAAAAARRASPPDAEEAAP